MEFLGVGPAELVFILIIALIVVGPQRLPVLARQAGKILVTVRDWIQKSPDAAMIMRARQEIEAELANIRSSLAEVQYARDEVVQAAKQVTTMVTDEVIAPTRAALDEAVQQGSIARATKPNGVPVEAAPATEQTIIAPDGSVLVELPPASETATIRPPSAPKAAPATQEMQALSTQVAALASELRALQVQLQERGVLTAPVPAIDVLEPTAVITTSVPPVEVDVAPEQPILDRELVLAHQPAPEIQEEADVEQPVLLRD